MPRFDGMQALKLSLELDPTLPFIILTGSKNEETAVLCLKSGASDYVIKSHIGRLSHAVREALERARLLKEKNAAFRALRESEEGYRTLADSGQALIWSSGVDKLCYYFNKTWLDFTGRSLEQECGNGWTEGVHPEDLPTCVARFEDFFDRREKFSIEYRLRRYDGEYRWVQDDGSPRYGANGKFLGYIGHCLDITEHKAAEARLRLALGEKETLLRELVHRTRNNMQVILSILDLEADAAHDEVVSRVILKANDRIMSMALVQKKLYDAEDLSRIDLKSYSEELLAYLRGNSFYPGERVALSFEAEPIFVQIDTAVPFGLVLHELVLNAFQHAFPDGRSGVVRIALGRKKGGEISLEVADDGVGLPGSVDPSARKTVGFKLLVGLVEDQLGGSLVFKNEKGFSCQLAFEERPAAKRI
jgi:PAS domain S-box-containing protein